MTAAAGRILHLQPHGLFPSWSFLSGWNGSLPVVSEFTECCWRETGAAFRNIKNTPVPPPFRVPSVDYSVRNLYAARLRFLRGRYILAFARAFLQGFLSYSQPE